MPAQVTFAALLAGGKVDVFPDGGDVVMKVDGKDRQDTDATMELELDKPALDIASIKPTVRWCSP